ncbi:MAG: tetratricopeptide repeat protein [Candidatus Moraniibacteriota bacterium]|nr:MAG: tetratricopeptide repeat protein [Candidatus Moranbacteria bacterium]
MQKVKKIELYLKKNPRATERDLERKFGLTRTEARMILGGRCLVERGEPKSFWCSWYGSEKKVMWTLLALACVVRGLYAFFLMREDTLLVPLHDAEYYLKWAEKIVTDGWLGDRAFFTEPLYAYLLALALTLFGSAGSLALLVLQFVLGALAPLGLYLLSRRLLNRETALATGLLATLYGPFLFYEGLLLKTSLEVSFLPWVLLLIFYAFEKGKPVLFFGSGIALGVFSLIKGNNLLWVPVVIGLLLSSWQYVLTRRMLLSGCLVIGVVLIIFPVTVRNYVVSHDFVLTNYSFGLALYQGNWWGGDGSTALVPPFLRPDPRYEEVDAVGMAEATLGHTLTPSQVSSFWVRQALSDMSEAPGHFLATLWNKVLLIFNHSEFSDNYQYSYYRDTMPLLWFLPNFWLVSILAVIGGILFFWRDFWQTMRPEGRLRGRSFLLFFGASVLVLLLTTVNARYRLPLLPFFLILAGGAVAYLIRSVREGRTFHPVILAMGALMALLLAWYPLPVVRFDTVAQSYHALGYQALTAGQYIEAQTLLKKTLEVDPQYAWAYGNLMLTNLALGQVTEAEGALKKLLVLRSDDLSNYRLLTFFREVRDLPPTEREARVKASVSRVETPPYDPDWHEAERLLHVGDDRGAENALRRSLIRHPDAPASTMALSALLKKAGKTEEAKRLLTRVVENHPELFPVRYNLANLYIMEENYGKAAELLRDIYEFTPELGETWYNYAVALIKQKRTSEAIPVMQAYIDRYEDDAARKSVVEKFRTALKPTPNTIESLLPGKR